MPRRKLQAVAVGTMLVAAVALGGSASRAATSGFITTSTTAPASTTRVNCDAKPWLCGIVLGTWQKIVDPTWTGPGSEPIYVSACSPDVCGFGAKDGNGANRFIVELPHYIFTETKWKLEYDDMSVIKAMLQLDPRVWAPQSIYVMPESLTVAPSYAQLLRKAGISPAVFLAWMMSGLPGDQVREAWHCAVFGCKGDGFDTGNYVTLPAGERGGIARTLPRAVASGVRALANQVAHVVAAPVRHAATGSKAREKVKRKVRPGKKGSREAAPSRAASASSAGFVTGFGSPAPVASQPQQLSGFTTSASPAPAPPASSTAKPVPSVLGSHAGPLTCPPGLYPVVMPNGSYCGDAAAAGVRPGPSPALVGGVAAALLAGAAGAVLSVARRRRSYL